MRGTCSLIGQGSLAYLSVHHSMRCTIPLPACSLPLTSARQVPKLIQFAASALDVTRMEMQ
jgi:hypothetical protein